MVGRPKSAKRLLADAQHEIADLRAERATLSALSKAEVARAVKVVGGLATALHIMEEFLQMEAEVKPLSRWRKFVLLSLDQWIKGALKDAEAVYTVSRTTQK